MDADPSANGRTLSHQADDGVRAHRLRIVGAWPAGLTATIYLERFMLTTRTLDAGCGQCATIPLMRSHAGYPGDIAGADLLDRMRRQAAEFGVTVDTTPVKRVGRQGDRFEVWTEGSPVVARIVLLATGVVNRHPLIDDADHDSVLEAGLLRCCPICDCHEVVDKRVGVIGSETNGYSEAMFIRMYTKDVTLIAPWRRTP